MAARTWARNSGVSTWPASSRRFASDQAGATLWYTAGPSPPPYQPMPKPSPFVVSTPMRECRLCSMRPCLGLKSNSSMSTGCPYHAIHRHIVFSFRGQAPPVRVVGADRPARLVVAPDGVHPGRRVSASPPVLAPRRESCVRRCPRPRAARALRRARGHDRCLRLVRAVRVTAIGSAPAGPAAAALGGAAVEPRPPEYRYGAVLVLVL